MDNKKLKQWFINEKRDLPWRENPSPYAVWVSEMMLQQTQVSVVIPYFMRWMDRFPSIRALASADISEVIKVWEGLGYYSRARYLHEGARYIVEHFGGELPSDEESLKKIKGIGPYTIGAIRSFAFHQRTSAVDGNVMRVLARYYAIEDDISKSKTVAMMRQKVEVFLPASDHWVVNEAMIELGALICTKAPRCQECPLRGSCKAHLEGIVDRLPVKEKKVKTERLHRAVAVICCRGSVLLRRGKKGEVMHDLHEFPYFEGSGDAEILTPKGVLKQVKEKFGLSVAHEKDLCEQKHSFTRYRVHLSPSVFVAKVDVAVEGYEWYTLESVSELAFSSGHRRVLNDFLGTFK
jgi:A/G-specific adenine glycosylase